MAAAASKARWRDCTAADPLLQIRELTKRFGGVLACDRISLDVPAGGLRAIIGPNGAGKSTPIGQLAGEINPDAGRIFFNGRDITRLPIHHRSALGLARSFQITSLFLDFTVLDNVALAIQAHAGHSFRFWRPARHEAKLRGPARGALARVWRSVKLISAAPTHDFNPLKPGAPGGGKYRDLLRPQPSAFRGFPHRRGGRNGEPSRPQRHGQDHGGALHHGIDAG
jgi:branched-chain amino acid transport system ATP-binding protein